MTETSTRGAITHTPLVAQQTLQTHPQQRRIEVETLATELRHKLGPHWDKYQATIAEFLIGKLSRTEFTGIVQGFLTDSRLVRMHNQLLLANVVNALRDGPDGDEQSSKYSFGSSSKKPVKKGMKQSSQYEKLKKDVMSLPIRERYRIKTITRESGKQRMANSSLTLTRQSLLPQIPFSSEKEKVLSNVIEYTQDINHALNTPLATETFALPDQENLKTRMLGISREHGLTGALNNDVAELLYHGLEAYLKNIVESAIDTVRYRRKRYAEDGFDISDSVQNKKLRPKVTLMNEDMVDTFDLHPFLVEPSGSTYRLHAVSLQDDTYIEPKCGLDGIVPVSEHPAPQTSTTTSSVKASPLMPKKEASMTQDSLKNIGDRDELNGLIRDILLTN